MATLDEIKRAGLEVSPAGSGEQIMNLISGVPAEMEKKQEKQKQDTMDQVKLYTQLREAGYTPEDAHKRVTRTYRSTDFIENLVGGGRDENVLTPPTQTDKVGMEQEKGKAELAKTKAETGKTKAETRKAIAQSGYYNRGGAQGRNYEGLTPNQIQTRIKSLQGQLGMGSEEEDSNLNSEIGYLNDLFNKKSGFKQTPEAAAPDAAAGAGNAPATTVIMTGPDRKKYKIPKQNVQKAKARGFK